jgi:FHS family L-fucose permease-like MFS transporter
LFNMSIGVFFIGGFLTSMVALLVPRLRLTLGLDYAQAMLIQLAFHSSYLLFAMPVTLFILRSGYMRAIATGLAVMVAGCLGFAFAHEARSFMAVLAALLLLSVGITFLQIAANTVVTVIGPSRNAAARLTLLQGFNSLGTVLGPLLGAQFLLADVGPSIGGGLSGGGRSAVLVPFLLSAVVLVILSLAYALRRDLLTRVEPAAGAAPSLKRLRLVLADPRLRTGTLAMFAYVGAEVTIGTLLTNYLMQSGTLGAAPVAAGQMVSLYWGGAMVGRFAGAFALGRIAPARLLAGVAVGAAALVLVGCVAGGVIGAVALLAVGLCNAIMYPTIFALAMPAAESEAPVASMLLCMAVVGGAVVPVVTGAAADATSLGAALAIPALCYLGIAWFARSCAVPRVVEP